jgi:hypothetical protein
MKVSFDFDGVFEYKPIQYLVRKLIESGFDVHIVTGRSSDTNNNDLFSISDKFIRRKNVHFTNESSKFIFFKDKDFVFHLDDDELEVREINENTSVKGIFYDNDFERNIFKIIKKED